MIILFILAFAGLCLGQSTLSSSSVYPTITFLPNVPLGLDQIDLGIMSTNPLAVSPHIYFRETSVSKMYVKGKYLFIVDNYATINQIDTGTFLQVNSFATSDSMLYFSLYNSNIGVFARDTFKVYSLNGTLRGSYTTSPLKDQSAYFYSGTSSEGIFVGRIPTYTTGAIQVFDLNQGVNPILSISVPNYFSCTSIYKGYVFTSTSTFSIDSYSLTNGSQSPVTYLGATSSIVCMTIVDDYLYAGTTDFIVIQWKIGKADLIKTFSKHIARVNSIFVANGYLFSGSSDMTVIRWNINTGDVINTFLGHTKSVTSVIISGIFLFSFSEDNTIRQWNIPLISSLGSGVVLAGSSVPIIIGITIPLVLILGVSMFFLRKYRKKNLSSYSNKVALQKTEIIKEYPSIENISEVISMPKLLDLEVQGLTKHEIATLSFEKMKNKYGISEEEYLKIKEFRARIKNSNLL